MASGSSVKHVKLFFGATHQIAKISLIFFEENGPNATTTENFFKKTKLN